jgi:hypothetical protein
MDVSLVEIKEGMEEEVNTSEESLLSFADVCGRLDMIR